MFGRGAGNRYGTEDDKVNCMFYLKTGVCRHFDNCSKQHVKPVFSRILLCKNLWSNPYYGIMPEDIDTLDETFLQNQFDGFFEEVFEFFSWRYDSASVPYKSQLKTVILLSSQWSFTSLTAALTQRHL